MRTTRQSRGFTIVELMATLGIAAVLLALSVAMLTKLKGRGTYASATGEFVAGLRLARSEAIARGEPVAVVIDTAAGQWWVLDDPQGAFTLDGSGTLGPNSFDGGLPAAPGDGGVRDQLLAQGKLPAGTSFGPPEGFGVALPAPLSGIPTGYTTLADGGMVTVSSDGGTAPNARHCSFCDTSSGRGAIVFQPSGAAQFNSGPGTIGQQISMQNVNVDGGASVGGATLVIDYAIVQSTGSIQAVTIK